MPLFFYILLLIYGIGAFYSYQALKKLTKNRGIRYAYLFLFAGVLINLFIQFSNFDRSRGMNLAEGVSLGIFLAFMLFGLIVGVFLLVEDITRVGTGIVKFIRSGKKDTPNLLPSRRRFISQMAFGIASVPFASLLYGMYKGKYAYQVLNYTLNFDDLPVAFDGLRIVQISDIHSGSFDDKEKVNYGIDLINQQKGDLILFTGDLVNYRASEMLSWKSSFSTLQAPMGVFSILGNHDYGDYVEWETEKAKEKNLQELKNIQADMGFELLLNEHRYLERDGQRIALLGVENWGAGRFKKAGDLEKTLYGVDKADFKILMSHDPSHWEQVVLGYTDHIHLTLSGHTHGMQFGIEVPGYFKWSPAQWQYTYWAGLYEQMGKYINVNRGFGFIGYPGRVGIYPEITVIELRRGRTVV